MELYGLAPKLKLKKSKRVGRGGKRGTFSGHGSKGQKSRAGHRIRPTERDLIMRLPKLRGIKNKSLKEKPQTINVSFLDAKFDSGAEITMEALKKSDLIKRSVSAVKVLSGGETKKKFTVKGITVSAKAKEKLEKSGGSVEK